MQNALNALAAELSADTGVPSKAEVFKQREGLTLPECLMDFVQRTRPDVVIISFKIVDSLPTYPKTKQKQVE